MARIWQETSGMLVTVLVLFVCVTNGDVVTRCSDGEERGMALEPSADGVPGRYTATWCTPLRPNATEWRLELFYHKAANETKCPFSPLRREAHSKMFHDVDFTCKNVCLSVNFDLVFAGCYGLEGSMHTSDTSLPPDNSYHYIKNALTRAHFSKILLNFTETTYEDSMVLHWFLGIPITKIKKKLCEKNNRTDVSQESKCKKYDDIVNKNCTVGPLIYEMTCSLSLPGGVCYDLVFEHVASWVEGMFSDNAFIYHNGICPVRVSVGAGGGGGAPWAGGAGAAAAAVGAAGAGGLAALGLWLRRRALRRTPPHTMAVLEEGGEAEGCEDRSAEDILLLYGREGPLGAALVAALRDLLQHATSGTVHDVFTGETMCLVAPAGGEWVRRAVCGGGGAAGEGEGGRGEGGARVVLLETPAAALLAPSPGSSHALHLSEPLLGRRAVYRRPQFGDSLVAYALRLLADGPHHHRYTKYYRLCIPSVPACPLPALVPYTRYSLPHAAGLLLQTLSPRAPPPPPAALRRLRQAVDDFAHHVRDNPNYLDDELVLVD